MVNKTIGLIAIAIAVAATIGSIATAVIAMKNSDVSAKVRGYLGNALNNKVPCNTTQPIIHPMWRFKRGFVRSGIAVEISNEFKEKVIKILELNPNTSNLLANGYNITYIKPIINLIVQGDGSVVMKVIRAIVLMVKPGEGRVLAYVNLETSTIEKLIRCEVVIKGLGTSGSTIGSTEVPSGTM
ncbi:MAG: hypothetical protein QXL96_06840 [Ignisphaera sp.]